MKLKEKWDELINGPHDKREKEFLPAILEVTETPPSPVGRLVMWSILGLLVVGLIWACVGKINEVAVATGKHTVWELKQRGADHALADFADLPAVLRILGLD